MNPWESDSPRHGGAVFHYARLFNTSPEVIVDLSSSVNPLALRYVERLIPQVLPYVLLYPPQTAEEVSRFMEEAVSIPADFTFWGNGSYELLSLSGTVFLKDKHVLILEPTFVGYARLLKLARPKEVFRLASLKLNTWLDLLSNLPKSLPKVQALVVCNPNNPTGWLIPKKFLWETITENEQILFFVDEAFIDFAEEESLTTNFINNVSSFPKNLFIFRSLSKFYGLAGLRLGYLVSHPENIVLLCKASKAWPVQTLSLVLAKRLLLDETFKSETLAYFRKEREYFLKELNRLGIFFFQSNVNYVLFKIEGGKFFWENLLLSRRILLRRCDNFYGLDSNYLRISLKERASSEAVLEEIKNWFKSKKPPCQRHYLS